MKKTLKLLCLVAVIAAMLMTAVWADGSTVTLSGSAPHASCSPAAAADGNPFVVTINPEEGYCIDNVTEVKVGSSVLATSAWSVTRVTEDSPSVKVSIDSYTTSKGNIVITASASNSYVITCKSKADDGTDVTKTVTYTYGADKVTIADPAEPDGKYFVGWLVTTAAGNWDKDETFEYNSSKYGDITITAQYEDDSGIFVMEDNESLDFVRYDNVLTLSLSEDYDDDKKYDLPLYVTVKKYQKRNDGLGMFETTLVEGTDYTYDRETGKVTVDQKILNVANVVVFAEADDVREIYVAVETSNLIINEGESWANKRKAYKLSFDAAYGAALPTYVTVELVTGKDESQAVDYTYTTKNGTGTITIEKKTLADLYGDENLDEKYFANGKYYLSITAEAKVEGAVKLTTYKGKTTKVTDGWTMSLEDALKQIDTDAAGKNGSIAANRAVIELLGDVTTTEQITVAEDFSLEITTGKDAGPCTLTSTYTSKKANRNQAIVLEEDAELEMDIAGLFYKADVAVYDAIAEEEDEESDVTETYYPCVMTITGDKLEGTYLLADADESYDFAEALELAMAAAKTCDDAVVLDVLDGKYTETGAVTLPEDVTVVLGEKASVTLSKKALALNGQTVEVAGALNLKGVSGTGSLILTAAKAAITSDTQLVDLVSTNVPDMFVSEETAGGSYIYTVSDVEPEEIEETEDAEADGAEAEQAGEEFGDLATGEITITCGVGGTAAPASFTLTEGDTQVVSITLDAGYSVSSITVNGVVTGTDKLIATSTGYVLNWDTAEDSSIAITFVATPTFSDVTADAWFYSNVMFTTSKGLMVGFPGGTFEPYDTMTVAQYLTVMYRYLQDQAPAHVAIKSTTGSSWTEGAYYVNTAFLGSAYQNIETTKLTRYAVADITYRVLKALESYTGKTYSNSEALSFTDVPATDSYYTAVTYLSTVNIIDGYVTGGIRTYAGANTITRAEIAKVLNRLMLVG